MTHKTQSNSRSPIYRAIDVGYGLTKYTQDSRGTCGLFPSLAPVADIHRARTGLVSKRDTTLVWVHGSPYEVGPDTTLFVDEVPVLNEDYIQTPQYLALLYGALDAMQIGEIDLLVVGLPVHQYGSHAEYLRKLLQKTHTIRPEQSVTIHEVRVSIQPLGGLVSHTYDRRKRWELDKDRTYLLVDPGYYTFDWLLARGLAEIPGCSGSITCGVSQYLTCIQQLLISEMGAYCADLRRIDLGLRSGHFQVGGREFDLKPLRDRAEVIVDRALRALRNRVDAAQGIDEIVLVGGGSEYFVSGLKRAFPNHEIQVPKDAAMANVRGFHLLAKILLANKHHEGGSCGKS
jgi:plasmid segregation protein ParM